MMNDIEHNKHSFSKHLYIIPPHPILYTLRYYQHQDYPQRKLNENSQKSDLISKEI